MRDRIVYVLCIFSLSAMATNRLNAREPAAPAQQTPEFSIHGTWMGYWQVGGMKVKLTCYLRADGTYKTVVENGPYVSVERGKFTYSDGVLTTEPEGGMIGTFTVAFENRDTIKVKGGGISITYQRQ